MATVQITNGFPNFGEDTSILAGILLQGEINDGDLLIIDKENVLISKVEFDPKTYPGITHVRLFVSKEDKIVWHKLYGHCYETQAAY